MRFVLDQERLAQLGLSQRRRAEPLQTLLSGATATQLRDGNRLVDVVVRAPPEERLRLDRLGDLIVDARRAPCRCRSSRGWSR